MSSIDDNHNLNVSGTTEPHNSNQSGCTGDQQSCAINDVLSTSNSIQAVEAQQMVTSSSHASFTCENQTTDIDLTVNLTEESTTSAFDKETSSDASSVSLPVTKKKQRLDCK